MRKWGIFLCAALIFCSVLFFRAASTHNIEYFSDDDSYAALRYNGVYDDLSYGGRSYLYNTISLQLLSFFSYLPFDQINFFSNIVASLVTVFIFFFSYLTTKNVLISSGVSTIGGFIPLHYVFTLNAISPYLIIIPLSILCVSLFIAYFQTQNRWILRLCILSWILATLIHPIFFVFILGFVFHIFFLYLEKKKATRLTYEFLLFIIIAFLFLTYLGFYNAIQAHGLSIFTAGTLFSPYVSFETIVPLLPQMGIFMLALAGLTIYQTFTKEFDQRICFITAIMGSALLLIILRILSADEGFLFISFMAVVILPFSLQSVFDYLTNTKFVQKKYWILFSIIISLFVSMFLPVILYTQYVIEQATPNNRADFWKEVAIKIPSNATIITPVGLSQEAMYFAEKKTVVDSNTLLIVDATTRANTVSAIYRALYPSQLFELTKNMQSPLYIYTDSQNNVSQPLLERCFTQVVALDMYTLYEVTCHAQ